MVQMGASPCAQTVTAGLAGLCVTEEGVEPGAPLACMAGRAWAGEGGAC